MAIGPKTIWAGLTLAALLATGGAVAFSVWPRGEPAAPASRPEAVPGSGWAPTTEPADATVAQTTSAPPSFDLVRVAPNGSAIVAGRAEPGADVVVRDGDVEVARVRAGADGAFVALPSAPFSPGGRELTLTARGASGVEVSGDGSVLLVVPPPVFSAGERGPGPAGGGDTQGRVASAVLVPNEAAPRGLQGGGGRDASRALTLDTVDYDDKGSIQFKGGAAIGGALRLYVDNGPVGDVQADDRGRWMLKPDAAMPTGIHSLRVDELDDTGQVVARVELPFERATISAAALVKAGGRVVVQPGQNLWRLARAVYGQGVRYRVIYLANRDQIRDPRRIYPGQTFAVPKVRVRPVRR